MLCSHFAAEEQETFALALAQEMRAMKERYEKQLEGTRDELRTAQRLRAETAQRLRSDLESERQRHQQTVSAPSKLCHVQVRYADTLSRH